MSNKVLVFLFLGFITMLNAADFRKDTWEKTEYIWDFGIISSCDVGVPKSPIKYFLKEPDFNINAYQNIKKGDIVWLQCRFIPQFSQQVLPNIKHPFILVISDGDESFPTDSGMGENIEAFIADEKIVHIFAQNYDCLAPNTKITHLPIGMDFHTIGYKSANGGWGEKGMPKQQEKVLKRLLKTFKATSLRKKKAFVDFQLSDTMRAGFKRYLQFGEDRTTIFNKLLPTGLIDHAGFMKRHDLWKIKGEYAFSISPHGNGLDCHRTWEDMVLGCIVILKTSSLDPMYEGLPIVIVDDWSEITSENMEKWLVKYGDAFTNTKYRKKLTNQYWLNKIQSVKKNILKT